MARGRRRKARVKNAASTVQSLVERMANITVSGKRRRRRRRGGQPQQQPSIVNIPGAEGTNPSLMSFGGSRRRGRKVRVGTSVGNGGRITLSRCELYTQVTVVKAAATAFGDVPIYPPAAQATVFPFLANLARVYTRLKWERIVFEWRPAVGTTTNGIITYGVRLMDDSTTPPTSRIAISALSPVNDHPVWQASDMPVPAELLQSRKWYAIQRSGTGVTNPDLVDLGPGSLQFGLNVDVNPNADRMYGEFWISYTVVLDGCRPGNG